MTDANLSFGTPDKFENQQVHPFDDPLMSPSFAPNNPQPQVSIDEDYMGSLDQYAK